jgi:hypothetical protein
MPGTAHSKAMANHWKIAVCHLHGNAATLVPDLMRIIRDIEAYC